jgi:hypothetical protein
VKSAGGYFDQLTAWIHATYPALKLIGNAGAPLVNNLNNYGNLVDVLVSYENSYAEAQGFAEQPPQYLLGAPIKEVTKQLALFHDTDTASNMEELVSKAFGLGYTHVYVNDGKFDNGKGNPWKVTPAYIDQEMSLVFPPATLR